MIKFILAITLLSVSALAQDDISLGYTIGNGRLLGAKTYDGQGTVGILGIDSSGNTVIKNISGKVISVDSLRLPNNTYLLSRNAGNSADLNMIKADTSNNTIINASAATDTIQFAFGGTPRLIMAYETDGGHPNVEIYAATADGSDNQFLLISAGGGPANFNGTTGAMLELSGNEGAASPGRAQIFTGAVPTGYLVLDVMHSDGLLIKQSVSTTVQTEKLSTGENVTYQNISWAPNSGTKTYSFLSGMYVDTGAGKFEIPNGTTIPATCTVGEIFQDTNSDNCADGAGDGAICVCKTTNTWALVANV